MLLKNRTDLAKYFNKLGFRVGAEVGVLRGDYSVVLCKANPDLKLYCIDSWGLNEKRYAGYHQRMYEKAKYNLAPYNTKLIKKLSLEATADFADDSLDFVYIDANHKFDYVIEDIIEWTKKVRSGGIVAGHDYLKTSLPGPKDAVDTYLKYHLNLKLNLTAKSDKPRSWWFVKL